jgi:hypothetical protein
MEGNCREHRRRGGQILQLQVGIVRGTNCTADAAKRLTEEGGGLTWVILDAGLTTMMTCVHGLAPGHCCCCMFLSLDEFHDLGSVFFQAGGGGQGR